MADRHQPDPAVMPPLLSTSDLADLLRTTPRHVHNLKARGQIPAPAKVPGLGLRWRRADVDAWLAEQLAA